MPALLNFGGIVHTSMSGHLSKVRTPDTVLGGQTPIFILLLLANSELAVVTAVNNNMSIPVLIRLLL